MSEIKVNMENLTDEQRKQLMGLIETANNSKKPKLFNGDKYYFITTFGNISQSNYCHNSADNILLKNGNVFKTRKEAKFEVEKRKVIAELQNYADKYNKEIDWDDITEGKFSIIYEYRFSHLKVKMNLSDKDLNNIYFSSADLCRRAIDFVGEDRIKKYLFKVE